MDKYLMTATNCLLCNALTYLASEICWKCASRRLRRPLRLLRFTSNVMARATPRRKHER